MEPEGSRTVINGPRGTSRTVINSPRGPISSAEPEGRRCDDISSKFSILNVSSDIGTASISTLTPDSINPRFRKVQRRSTPIPDRACSSSSSGSSSDSSTSEDESPSEQNIRHAFSARDRESVPQNLDQQSSPAQPAPHSKPRPIVKILKEHDGKPQDLLYAWFGKNEGRNIGKECYVVDDGKGPDHQKKSTAFLIHPKTFEVFPSGRFLLPGEEKDLVRKGHRPVPDQTDQYEVYPLSHIVCYKTKKLAMAGAAARAYDCITYRKGLETGEDYEQIGEDKPALSPIPLSNITPETILDEIRAKKGHIVQQEQRIPTQNAIDDQKILHDFLRGTFFD